MAFKPNYRFERAERDRQKKARKEQKLKRQQERSSSRQESPLSTDPATQIVDGAAPLRGNSARATARG